MSADLLVTIGYIVVGYLVLNRGSDKRLCLHTRLQHGLLGSSVVTFGTGRFLMYVGNPTDWILTAGHCFFFAFAVAHFWNPQKHL